jgi:colanic acid/amylovoran biosynthesis glycosyltransferase
VEAGCRLADKYPDLQIRLIGRENPNVVREISEKVRLAGHQDMLEFSGHLGREELAVELSRAHVFAAPSDYEGGPGFVCLEAMACGLPVIACNGSGVSEIIEDGITGFLVPPRDVDALGDALACLLSDAKKRTEMGRAARAYVEREANSDDCIRRFESFYSDVLQKCRRVPELV